MNNDIKINFSIFNKINFIFKYENLVANKFEIY